MEALKPGLHWDAIQLLCHRTLVRGFQRLGIFKTPNSPNSGSWNAEEAILASGVSSAFFPHGVGHSLGMDVHDVPSASKPENNETIARLPLGHESFYTYLRLRLPLEKGMVVVSLTRIGVDMLKAKRRETDGRARHLLLPSPPGSGPRLEAHRS